MKSYLFSLVLILLLVCSSLRAENSVLPRLATLPDSVIHGMALFESMQGRQFSAISIIMRASRLSADNTEQVKSMQLLAELYSSYGLLSQSTKIYNAIVKNSTTDFARDAAWYGLAQQRYRQGYFSVAAVALNNIHSDFIKTNSREYQEMLANVYIVKKQYTKVKNILNDNKTQFWQAYAQLNLAKKLIVDNKIIDAIVLLQGLAAFNISNSDFLALCEESYLTLGYIFLKQNKPQQAITEFNKIGLLSVSANKALLGLGLAWKQRKLSKKAMSTWTELASRNFTDPAVQQAWYLMPVYLEKINKPELAVIQYQQANNRIDNQLATIDEIIGIVVQGEFLRTLKPNTNSIEHSLAWLNNTLPVSISSLYLYRLMASKKFQDAVSQYQDIVFLHFTTVKNNSTLVRLENNLESQIVSFKQKFDQITASIENHKIANYKSKRDKFFSDLNQIEKTNSSYALANVDEMALLEQLDSIGARLNRIPENKRSENTVSRFQILDGIVKWQLAASFKQRLVKTRVSIQALNSALINNEKVTANLYGLNTISSWYPELLKKVKTKSRYIIGLKSRVENVLEQQGHYIESLALTELRKQRSRLQSYQRRIRFAQARLFDQLAQAQESKP